MKILFRENTLNIFTDASVKQKPNGNYISCPGAIAVMTKEYSEDGIGIIDHAYTVLDNATNNAGEIHAVYLGVLLALKYRDKFERINIISDSQFSIYGLTKWIYNWKNNIVNDNYISSSNKLVANQDMFKKIIHLILLNNIKINFYHQKGHAVGAVKKARQVFNTSNGILLDDFELMLINKFNDIIDVFTGEKLDEPAIEFRHMLKYSARFNSRQYKELVNNRKPFC